MRRAVVGPERRNPCTHMTMTRLYDAYGSFKCNICHKHPSLGWLYRCTQDTGGVLPESDFTEKPPIGKERPVQDVTTHSLSSSVIKAIGEGHYTGDQIKKLIQLKEGVRNLVLSPHQPEYTRPATSSTFSTSSSSSSDGDCTFSTIPQSTTFSTTSSTSLDDEIKQAYDWKELQKIWMSEPSTLPPEPRIQSLPPSLLSVQPLPQRLADVATEKPCSFMTCHTCRPTYRERAYPSLDDILNKPTQMPPVWEVQNRRVSDARIVARMGLPKLDRTRFYAQANNVALQSSRTIPDIVIDDTDAEVDCYDPSSGEYMAYMAPGRISTPANPSMSIEPKENHSFSAKGANSPSKRSGFRQSIRKVISTVRRDEVPSTDSSTGTSTSESSVDLQIRPQPRSRASSSLLFHRRRSRSSTLSFIETPGARIVDTSLLQESVTLMVATNTPLPPTPRTNGFNLVPATNVNVDTESVNHQGSYFPPFGITSQA